MNMTQTTAPDIFDTFTRDDRWCGFGYLGGRNNHLADVDDPELEPIENRRAQVAEIDARILAVAASKGWTHEHLFAWANSKNGRWFADAAFGGTAEDVELAFGRWNLLTLPR